MWTNEKEKEFQKLQIERENYLSKKKAIIEALDEVKELFNNDKINLTFGTEYLYNNYDNVYGEYCKNHINPVGKKIIFEYYYKKEK